MDRKECQRQKEKKSDRGKHKARERQGEYKGEITTMRVRERDVIIISNTPARGKSEKGQERVGQRCR